MDLKLIKIWQKYSKKSFFSILVPGQKPWNSSKKNLKKKLRYILVPRQDLKKKLVFFKAVLVSWKWKNALFLL